MAKSNPVSEKLALGRNAWFEPTCFLCHEFFVDPVTLDCGHNFCYVCIEPYWGQAATETLCPRCKVPVLRTNLKSNDELEKAVRMAKWLCQGTKRATEAEKACKEHRYGLKYFCKDHLESFCSKCERCKEHMDHDTVLASEASQEYKNEILSCIEDFSKEKNDLQVHKSAMEKEWQRIIRLLEVEKERLVVQFEEIHQLVTEQCNSWLSKLDVAMDEMLLKKTEHMTELARERSKVDGAIRELEDLRRQRPLEFLQNIGSTQGSIMEKWEKKQIANLLPIPANVRGERIWELEDFTSFLPIAIREFEDILTSGKVEKIVLDPDADFMKLGVVYQALEDI